MTDRGEVSHVMLLYRGLADYTWACTEFIRAGVAVNAAVLVAATYEHLDSLRPQLNGWGDCVEHVNLTDSGADPGRVLSMIRMFARDQPGSALRFVRDVGWLGQPQEDLAEAIRYEALMCDALEDCGAHVLCVYDAGLDAAMLAAAERTHATVQNVSRPRASARQVASSSAPSGLAEILSSPPANAEELTFRGDQAAVRRFAATQARRAGLRPERVVDLVLAIAELAANTLRHTGGTGTLTAWTADDELICQVRDGGYIPDPLAGTICPDPGATGSRRGLWLVHQVCDLVQVRSGSSGTLVRVHMRLGRAPVRPDAGRNFKFSMG